MEYDAVRRNGRLYDRAHHTDKWTEETIECDVVYEYDWVDIPQPVQDFITARAATIVSQRIVGDGNQKRDFTYVTDGVEAIVKAFKSNINGEIFNVGSGNTISVNYIVKKLIGKKIFIPKRPGEPYKTFADIKKIKKYLRWKPRINIDKGIKLLLKNIDDWRDAPVWTKKKINIATKSWFKYLK